MEAGAAAKGWAFLFGRAFRPTKGVRNEPRRPHTFHQYSAEQYSLHIV